MYIFLSNLKVQETFRIMNHFAVVELKAHKIKWLAQEY